MSVSNSKWGSQQQGPRAKCDQVVFEALSKACESIVCSRTFVSGPTSPRFNLQIPEIPGVRKILSQYRQNLHIPLRLDVYSETGDSRELLERWHLEYAIGSTEQFLETEKIITNDPMVQLTHVCKRIVVWLRILYCNIRLLPAAKLKAKLGFSIYAATEPSSDEGLLLLHSKDVVTTPYGQLAWRVQYRPNLQHLLAVQPSNSVRIQVPQQQRPRPVQASSYTERSQQKHLEAALTKTGGKSFDPKLHTTKRILPAATQKPTKPILKPTEAPPPADGPPGRVLSGLSLALMNADPEDEPETDEQQARHAALHAIPPHQQQQQQQQQVTSSDYGYGYNNQIPWQSMARSLSPEPVESPAAPPTPPTAAFLGATPPKFAPPRTNSIAPPFPARPLWDGEPHVVRKVPLAPRMSMDSLRSSPFHVPSYHLDRTESSESDLRKSMVLQQQVLDDDGGDDDDMPFAVDLPLPTESLTKSVLGGSSSLASLAQKCAATPKLSVLSESTPVSQIADQLQEFQAFGASLQNESNASSSSTPISLRS